MGASRLPQELINAVTDNLRKDHGALLACSLVCRSWLPSSQRHLFRRVTFALDEDGCVQLAQVLLDSPHLANYIRELEVRVRPDHWDRERRSVEPDQSLPAAALRKLSKLQGIQLYNLEKDHLTVDLRQSLRWVLLLPSLTSLTHSIGQHENIDFLQDLFTRGDRQDDEPRERRYLSHLNLELAMQSNLDVYVDWFLGPGSPFEISHIQNLRVNRLSATDEKALNRLLRTIGSSLIQAELNVPNQWLYLTLGFDIKLEYNSNIRFLSLSNIYIEDTVDYGTCGTAWLQRFLSNIDASNKIEQIKLGVFCTHTFGEVYSAPGWGQIDCILAGKFRELEEVDIRVLAAPTNPK
ncbi:hypothetical protein JB92DRAFT_2004332 [Gautieria morchelliformis]|nr:hypothetical protein JB92DRAFT_2004332 [Gautieria morchelliformis]